MTAAVADPALGFWLRHVAAAGGLWEPDGDTTYVVLPAPLRDAYRLPEELRVTADPDVAREDGATLLTAGHPSSLKPPSECWPPVTPGTWSWPGRLPRLLDLTCCSQRRGMPHAQTATSQPPPRNSGTGRILLPALFEASAAAL